MKIKKVLPPSLPFLEHKQCKISQKETPLTLWFGKAIFDVNIKPQKRIE